MQNAGLDEAQAGIKIARRLNINNLKYADDTNSNGSNQRGIKELLDEVKESEMLA